jgi:hypothetical protein
MYFNFIQNNNIQNNNIQNNNIQNNNIQNNNIQNNYFILRRRRHTYHRNRLCGRIPRTR